jgi:mannose-1-phosphate guanylyltransferase
VDISFVADTAQGSARWQAQAASTFAVILAGGGGTRLWPASRRHRPKQLLHLGGGESLLAAAVRRAEALLGPGRTLIVTAADQADQIRQELPGLPTGDVIVEPEPRNTAGAVGLAAAAAIRRSGPSTILAILPADPHIGDEERFASAVRAAVGHASTGIVTVGLRPTYPESGFGYIRIGGAVPAVDDASASAGDDAASIEVFAVDRFVEKPTWELARDYVASGEYLWNSGMFFLTADRLLREARRQMPEMGAALDAIIGAPDFTAGINAHYRRVPIISIDHGIMEGAPDMRVVRADFGWNDVGSWAALSSIRPHDAHGNVVLGDGISLHDSAGSVVVSEPGAPYVGVVGVNDMVVVATADAILVVHKDRAQDVRKVVESAKAAGRKDLL